MHLDPALPRPHIPWGQLAQRHLAVEREGHFTTSPSEVNGRQRVVCRIQMHGPARDLTSRRPAAWPLPVRSQAALRWKQRASVHDGHRARRFQRAQSAITLRRKRGARHARVACSKA